MISLNLLALALLASAAVVHGTCNNAVTGFEVYDPYDKSFETIGGSSPYRIDLGEYRSCKINIKADTTSCPSHPIECVKITLGSQVKKEHGYPWYLYGNNGNNVYSGIPDTGDDLVLEACAYTDYDCTANPVCKSVDVDVVEGGKLSGFTITKTGGATIAKLLPGTTTNLCYNPTGVGLTIEAEADECVDSAYLELTGYGPTVTKTEHVYPFYIFGDVPGGAVTYKSTFVRDKMYTIEATPDGDSDKKITAYFTFKSSGPCI